MDFVLYADFTSVECYALNEQLVALGMDGVVAWHGVPHDPGAASPMRMLDRRTTARMQDEIEALQRLVPDLVIALPRGKPNTAKAIVAAASVMRQHMPRAAAFRTGLYRAYWREGVDLSVMANLQRIADDARVPRFVLLDDPDAEATAQEWELDWATERLGGVPRVIRGDGKILWGMTSREDVTAFFRP